VRHSLGGGGCGGGQRRIFWLRSEWSRKSFSLLAAFNVQLVTLLA